MRTIRKPTCTNMESATVQGLFVLFGFELETTISSNMLLTSCRLERDDLKMSHYPGVCCRLRVRFLLPLPGRANDSTRPQSVQQCQNWSMFLPQCPPPGQRKTRAKPDRPS